MHCRRWRHLRQEETYGDAAERRHREFHRVADNRCAGRYRDRFIALIAPPPAEKRDMGGPDPGCEPYSFDSSTRTWLPPIETRAICRIV
jgi:hypothetical protein